MAERLTLAEPRVKPEVITSTYEVAAIVLDLQNQLVVIRLKDNNGKIREFSYGGRVPFVTDTERQKASAIIAALATADLTEQSLYRRVMEQLIVDRRVEGTISRADATVTEERTR